jgi:hypothetical protein
VHRNDKISVDAVMELQPEGVVLSPGPCTPTEAGICLDLIERASATVPSIPILGVCLGHQAIGQAFGGKVIRAPQMVHGKLSEIRHDATGVLRGINGPFLADRRARHTAGRAQGQCADRGRPDHGYAARKPAAARRAVSSREHRLGARPSDAAEFSRHRRRLERGARPIGVIVRAQIRASARTIRANNARASGGLRSKPWPTTSNRLSPRSRPAPA